MFVSWKKLNCTPEVFTNRAQLHEGVGHLRHSLEVQTTGWGATKNEGKSCHQTQELDMIWLVIHIGLNTVWLCVYCIYYSILQYITVF